MADVIIQDLFYLAYFKNRGSGVVNIAAPTDGATEIEAQVQLVHANNKGGKPDRETILAPGETVTWSGLDTGTDAYEVITTDLTPGNSNPPAKVTVTPTTGAGTNVPAQDVAAAAGGGSSGGVSGIIVTTV